MADTASMVGVRRLGTLQRVVGAVTRGVHVPQASAPHLMLTTRPRGELEPFGWNEHNILTTGTLAAAADRTPGATRLSAWPTLAQPLPCLAVARSMTRGKSSERSKAPGRTVKDGW